MSSLVVEGAVMEVIRKGSYQKGFVRAMEISDLINQERKKRPPWKVTVLKKFGLAGFED